MKKRVLSLLSVVFIALSLLPAAATRANAVQAPPTAQWGSFRDSADNMGLTSAATPKSADLTKLNWAKQLGSGWSAAPSAQIIVDNSLVVMSGTKLYKLDLATGSTSATGTMAASPSYGYTPPTYAQGEGLIIAPLGGGVLQAFDANSLASVWIYKDNPSTSAGQIGNPNGLGGQALSPVTYSDGKLYTGFWNGETQRANFVCVDAATGALAWSYAVDGGFYWAGSVAVGDYIAVGTDDGASGYQGDSLLLVFQKTYGSGAAVQPVSSVTLTGCGDQRSSLALSGGKVYFTTKGGCLCSAAINGSTGAISGLKTVSFDRQSTSTPVIYGSYIYFGVGSGISASGSKGALAIAALDTLAVQTTVELKGYPQCSMLLSTAYVAGENTLYLYSTYNMTPGGLSLIKVNPSNPSGAVLEELYDAADYSNFCVASVISDTSGNLYYKNDSGYIFSVGKAAVPLPKLTTDLSTQQVRYETTATPTPLTIAAQVSSGQLSYQWQSSADGIAWSSIVGAQTARYTPPVSTLGTVYYRCAVTNTLNSASERVYSKTAEICVKTFSSDTDFTYALTGSNSTPAVSAVKTAAAQNTVLDASSYSGSTKPRLWLKAAEYGSIAYERVSGTDTFTLTAPTPASAGGYDYWLYFGSGLTQTNILKVTSTAEDGSTGVFYLILSPTGSFVYDSQSVYVTIAYKGTAVVFQQPVAAADLNFDGKYSVDETLYAAHQQFYQGGAAAGYATATGSYGLYLSKLWGDSSGNFGYYIDNAMAMGLSDTVSPGQHVAAYVTTNSYPSADAYSYFDSRSYTATAGASKTVSLSAMTGYDSSWAPVFGPYSTAALTAYDSAFHALAPSAYSVSSSGGGSYSVSFQSPGTYYLVATGAHSAIVPAVSVFTVGAASSGSVTSGITVSFRLIGAERADQRVDLTQSGYLPQYVTWISTDSYTLKKGASVADLFKQALDGAGLSCTGLSSGYISSVTAPACLGGYSLSEFSNGPKSGWMYTVNGSHPGLGFNACTLSDGDVVVLHYVSDYSCEVADWFDGLSYPALGDGTYWNGWLKAKDVPPTSAGKPEVVVPEGVPFADVDGHWALEWIQYVYEHGLLAGTSDTAFSPDAVMTRAMLVTVLYGMEGRPAVSGTAPFADAADGQYYAQAVLWASANGIVGGCGNGLFGSDDPITRQQLAAILYQYALLKNRDVDAGKDVSLLSYADAGSISPWAVSAMEWAVGAGLISGTDADSLSPAGTATRAQVAVILAGYLRQAGASA